MKLLTAALALLLAAGPAQAQLHDPQSDESAIRQVIADMEAA
jgi:hypothetical protein